MNTREKIERAEDTSVECDKLLITIALFTILILIQAGTAWSSFNIQSDKAVQPEIKRYKGLTETVLFKGVLAPGIKQHVVTTYQGLALLTFEQGQVYPIVIGEQNFLINITSLATPPSFTGSAENDYFYGRIKGVEPENDQYKFADLMIEAKQLLDSTGSIRSIDELRAMKEKYHAFVAAHYQNLYHSDMLRRLIAQYFMMHEYVDYHRDGFPAEDIRHQYQNAVLDGVKNWFSILSPRIAENEVLNYIVSLYYNRSMVSLASLIMNTFPDNSFCTGDVVDPFVFSDDLEVTNSSDTSTQISSLKGNKIIAFVSDDCPVSMVATIAMARKLKAQTSDTTMIVAPVDELSDKHVSMSRMINGGNLFFLKSNGWKTDIKKPLRLPLFQLVKDVIE